MRSCAPTLVLYRVRSAPQLLYLSRHWFLQIYRFRACPKNHSPPPFRCTGGAIVLPTLGDYKVVSHYHFWRDRARSVLLPFLFFGTSARTMLAILDYGFGASCVLTVAIIILVLVEWISRQGKNETFVKKAKRPYPPGPTPWPVIGNLAVMAKYEMPHKVFSELEVEYKSPIVKLKLGSVNSVVINGSQTIREVLFVNGSHFDARPNFERFNKLFGGDKENCESLILLIF